MKNTTPTTDQLAELVSYLPMLRRMASYEAEGVSIPAELGRALSMLGAIGEAIREGWTETMPAWERPDDEYLPAKAALLWTQVPGAREDAEAAYGHSRAAYLAVRDQATAKAKANIVAARVP